MDTAELPQVLVDQRMEAQEPWKQASFRQGTRNVNFIKLSGFMLLLLYFLVFFHDV